MYDFLSFHRKLNKKKITVVFMVVAILVIIMIVLFITLSKQKNKQKEITLEETKPNSIFYGNDNSISVELSKNYNLKQYDSTSNYLMELRSEENLGVFISINEINNSRPLKSIVKADRLVFTEDFNGYSNLSDIRELLVNGDLGYTYSFHYLDSNLNTPFYIQIVWLEINDKYYVFDIEFPLKDLVIYSNVVTEVLSSFKYM